MANKISHLRAPYPEHSPPPHTRSKYHPPCNPSATAIPKMHETLHLSSPTAAAATTSAAVSTQNKTKKYTPLSRPKHSGHPTPPPLTLPPIPKKPPSNQSDGAVLLQEKILYLDSLGIDSLYCLTAHPPILSAKLCQIKSTVDFLRSSVDLTTPDLRRAFYMCPEILSTPLHTGIRPAVAFLLREAHVRVQDLRHVINRRPRLLTRSVDRELRPTLYFLQATIGIEDVSKCATLLSSCVETKFIPRLDYFLKLGLPKREAVTLFRRFPSLFCYSVEQNLEPKFNYFVVEMRRDLRELVEFPHYFSFSLENRIKPRHRLCVEKGVCLSLPAMLKTPESRFRQRLDVCCNSSMPLRSSALWRGNIDCNLT